MAHDICARMRFGGRSLQQAVREVVLEELPGPAAARAASSPSTAHGEIAMEFNSEGMFRASRRSGEEAQVAIYRELRRCSVEG